MIARSARFPTAAVAGLCLLAAVAGEQAAATGVGLRDPETAVYTGEIDATRNRALFARAAGASLERLRISSPGGDVAAGIELGRWVKARGMDVEVVERCLSSCANYVFPAGRRKVIRPGAVVAWHGNYRHLLETGLWRDDVARRVERGGEDPAAAGRAVLAQVHRLVALEDAFFEDIGVDGRLCWVGKMPPHRVPDYFILRPPDMARFGVHDVSAPAGYPGADLTRLGEKVEVIRLEPGS